MIKMDDFKSIVLNVKATAHKDRCEAKRRGNENAAVYFQGKIAACNEILGEIKC